MEHHQGRTLGLSQGSQPLGGAIAPRDLQHTMTGAGQFCVFSSQSWSGAPPANQALQSPLLQACCPGTRRLPRRLRSSSDGRSKSTSTESVSGIAFEIMQHRENSRTTCKSPRYQCFPILNFFSQGYSVKSQKPLWPSKLRSVLRSAPCAPTEMLTSRVRVLALKFSHAWSMF